MQHKILPALLAVAAAGVMGLSPVSVQAAPLDELQQQLQNKGIIIAGTVTSAEELKQKHVSKKLKSHQKWPVSVENPQTRALLLTFYLTLGCLLLQEVI